MRVLVWLLPLLIIASSGAFAGIAIDVGHSLKSPGATGASGTSEFTYNQALARDVGSMLQRLRLPHQFIGLEGRADNLFDRTKQARSADVFVSLHHDSVQEHHLPRAREFSGYSLFVSRKNPFPEQSLQCAEKLALYLLQSGFTPTPHHNEPIKGENRPWANEALGVYWFDDLIVLKTAKQPAVLVEGGIIVNPDEEATVTSPDGRRRLAAALTVGLRDCYEMLEPTN